MNCMHQAVKSCWVWVEIQLYRHAMLHRYVVSVWTSAQIQHRFTAQSMQSQCDMGACTAPKLHIIAKTITFSRKTVITMVMTCRYTVQNVVTNREYECNGVQICNDI